MSDALTDIARDQSRGEKYRNFLELLTDYLESKDKTKDALKKIIEAARETDSVRGGYWGGRTKLFHGLLQRINALEKGDESEWARLLAEMNSRYPLYKRVKAISPFVGKMLIHVGYGRGFVNFDRDTGDLANFLSQAIAKGKGWETYQGDAYMVVLPEPTAQEIEVIWLERYGKDGPTQIEETEEF